MELIETGNERQLMPGDVLMVGRPIRHKDTGKSFNWQFFLVVTKHKRWFVKGLRIGAPEGKEEMSVEISDEQWTVQFVPMEEWPNGIHAFRMAMVFKGLIPDLV